MRYMHVLKCVRTFLPIAIDNGKYSRLLTRPEYHVNIYFNLREQAVSLCHCCCVMCALCFPILNFQKVYGNANTCQHLYNQFSRMCVWVQKERAYVSVCAVCRVRGGEGGWKRFFVYISIIDTKRTLRTYSVLWSHKFSLKAAQTLLNLIKQFTWRFMCCLFSTLYMCACEYITMLAIVIISVRFVSALSLSLSLLFIWLLQKG